MRNSPLTTMLLTASGILVLAAVALCWIYSRNLSNLGTAKGTLQQLSIRQQTIQPAVNALVAELVPYSETHRDIIPILESAGITNRPGAKPSAK